jgi:quinol monooxygenase YgiN
VDAASIEVSRRARRAKTDRLDAQALLEKLIRYEGGERRVWRVVGRTRILPGCVRCELLQDVEDPNRIALIESWDNEASLGYRIRSRDFRAVLAVIDMSIDQPELRFEWITRTDGLGWIEEIYGYPFTGIQGATEI